MDAVSPMNTLPVCEGGDPSTGEAWDDKSDSQGRDRAQEERVGSPVADYDVRSSVSLGVDASDVVGERSLSACVDALEDGVVVSHSLSCDSARVTEGECSEVREDELVCGSAVDTRSDREVACSSPGADGARCRCDVKEGAEGEASREHERDVPTVPVDDDDVSAIDAPVTLDAVANSPGCVDDGDEASGFVTTHVTNWSYRGSIDDSVDLVAGDPTSSARGTDASSFVVAAERARDVPSAAPASSTTDAPFGSDDDNGWAWGDVSAQDSSVFEASWAVVSDLNDTSDGVLSSDEKTASARADAPVADAKGEWGAVDDDDFGEFEECAKGDVNASAASDEAFAEFATAVPKKGRSDSDVARSGADVELPGEDGMPSAKDVDDAFSFLSTHAPTHRPPSRADILQSAHSWSAHTFDSVQLSWESAPEVSPAAKNQQPVAGGWCTRVLLHVLVNGGGASIRQDECARHPPHVATILKRAAGVNADIERRASDEGQGLQYDIDFSDDDEREEARRLRAKKRANSGASSPAAAVSARPKQGAAAAFMSLLSAFPRSGNSLTASRQSSLASSAPSLPSAVAAVSAQGASLQNSPQARRDPPPPDVPAPKQAPPRNEKAGHGKGTSAGSAKGAAVLVPEVRVTGESSAHEAVREKGDGEAEHVRGKEGAADDAKSEAKVEGKRGNSGAPGHVPTKGTAGKEASQAQPPRAKSPVGKPGTVIGAGLKKHAAVPVSHLPAVMAAENVSPEMLAGGLVEGLEFSNDAEAALFRERMEAAKRAFEEEQSALFDQEVSLYVDRFEYAMFRQAHGDSDEEAEGEGSRPTPAQADDDFTRRMKQEGLVFVGTDRTTKKLTYDALPPPLSISAMADALQAATPPPQQKEAKQAKKRTPSDAATKGPKDVDGDALDANAAAAAPAPEVKMGSLFAELNPFKMTATPRERVDESARDVPSAAGADTGIVAGDRKGGARGLESSTSGAADGSDSVLLAAAARLGRPIETPMKSAVTPSKSGVAGAPLIPHGALAPPAPTSAKAAPLLSAAVPALPPNALPGDALDKGALDKGALDKGALDKGAQSTAPRTAAKGMSQPTVLQPQPAPLVPLRPQAPGGLVTGALPQAAHAARVDNAHSRNPSVPALRPPSAAPVTWGADAASNPFVAPVAAPSESLNPFFAAAMSALGPQPQLAIPAPDGSAKTGSSNPFASINPFGTYGTPVAPSGNGPNPFSGPPSLQVGQGVNSYGAFPSNAAYAAAPLASPISTPGGAYAAVGTQSAQWGSAGALGVSSIQASPAVSMSHTPRPAVHRSGATPQSDLASFDPLAPVGAMPAAGSFAPQSGSRPPMVGKGISGSGAVPPKLKAPPAVGMNGVGNGVRPPQPTAKAQATGVKKGPVSVDDLL